MRTRVMILGHSHVRHLRNYVLRYRNGTDIKMNFDVSDAYVEMHGFSGLKTNQLLEPRIIRRIHRFKPHVVILLIGDNDVENCDTDELAANIVARASTLQTRHGVDFVFVCQLLPRYVWPTELNTEYDRKAHDINLQLRADIGPLNYMRFVYHGLEARFQCENENLYWKGKRAYRNDGVHLEDDGYRQLYKALRGVVIQASRLN